MNFKITPAEGVCIDTGKPIPPGMREIDHEIPHVYRTDVTIECAKCGQAAPAKDWAAFLFRHGDCKGGVHADPEPGPDLVSVEEQGRLEDVPGG